MSEPMVVSATMSCKQLTQEAGTFASGPSVVFGGPQDDVTSVFL
jgi:hypothetical protein